MSRKQLATGRLVDNKKDGSNGTHKRRINRDSGGAADWNRIDPKSVAALIAAVTACGGAVRFGYTSDQGAYSLGFYGDGDPYTEYIRPSEPVEEVLESFIAAWRSG